MKLPPKHIIEAAIEEVKKSNAYPFKLGAVIFKGNRIISKGFNHLINVGRKPNRFIQIKKDKAFSVHAEMAAILKSHEDLNGASIFVLRQNKEGEFRLAYPCDHCMKNLHFVGIKDVWYSVSENPYINKITLRKN